MTSPRLLSERYELGETLGYGGMSEVHHGRDTRLGREVAVKVLRADLARDPQFQERFRREAQNAASLNHPAIVAIYDTGDTNGEMGRLPYIVMEYVDGQTLREIVKTAGLIPQQRVLEVMADVCAALDFSHRHGIIHRDVKPANVMITRGGAVKVMDFGIARALADGPNMTQTSAVIGTAQYLSPEQARGEAVDARSDVYAAGCVLFELLTGQPPFTGDSPVAVAYQHVREDPKSPSAVKSDVPPTLDAIVLKSLSKNPANRYQSAAEMRNDLVRVLNGERPLAPAVMSDEDRTTFIGGGGARGAGMTGPTRRIAPSAARHQSAAPTWDEGDDGSGKRNVRAVLIGLAVVAVVGLLAFVAVQLLSSAGPEQVEVPNVVGQQENLARAALTKAGLKPDTVLKVSTVEEIGKVVGTDPAPGGTVVKNSKITMIVGSGPPPGNVPDLKDLTQEQAEAKLKAAGLRLVKEQKDTTDASKEGKVILQDPLPNKPPPPSGEVRAFFGKKVDGVPIPDLRDRTPEEAEAQLQALGFTTQRRSVDGGGTPDRVLSTNPAARTVQPRGILVTINISRGNLVTVPDLQGMTPNQARNELRRVGFRGTVSEMEAPAPSPDLVGRVIAQSPAREQSVDSNGEVVITIGRAP